MILGFKLNIEFKMGDLAYNWTSNLTWAISDRDFLCKYMGSGCKLQTHWNKYRKSTASSLRNYLVRKRVRSRTPGSSVQVFKAHRLYKQIATLLVSHFAFSRISSILLCSDTLKIKDTDLTVREQKQSSSCTSTTKGYNDYYTTNS